MHMAQLMPLPLTVSCFSEIQIGFAFLVPAHPGSPGKRAVKRVCVCVCLGLPRVGQYQKGNTNLDFTEAGDSEWQWHQLGHMQVCTSLQTDNHASTPPLSFLQAGCPSCRPTNSVKALKADRGPLNGCVCLTTFSRPIPVMFYHSRECFWQHIKTRSSND